MTINHILDALHVWAPPHLAESYDNVGLLLGNGSRTCTGVLVNLELTEAVLDEAIGLGANLIVCHHPIWFGKKFRLDATDWVSRLLLRAAEAKVALAACHTNLDNVSRGVNAESAARMGLQNCRTLQPKPGASPLPDGQTIGSGMLGELPTPLSKKAFLDHLKAVFGTPVLRYADCSLPTVQQVAICGGSGNFLLEAAIAQGADALVTGDLTHHRFFDADNRILLVDVGHYESEKFTTDLIVRFLKEKFVSFAVYRSNVNTNPVSYH